MLGRDGRVVLLTLAHAGVTFLFITLGCKLTASALASLASAAAFAASSDALPAGLRILVALLISIAHLDAPAKRLLDGCRTLVATVGMRPFHRSPRLVLAVLAAKRRMLQLLAAATPPIAPSAPLRLSVQAVARASQWLSSPAGVAAPPPLSSDAKVKGMQEAARLLQQFYRFQLRRNLAVRSQALL